jgi:hypothetical protein
MGTNIPKYANIITVSLPLHIADIVKQHCWEKGISRTDFVRSCIRFALNEQYNTDIEFQPLNNEKTNNQDPKLSKV